MNITIPVSVWFLVKKNTLLVLLLVLQKLNFGKLKINFYVKYFTCGHVRCTVTTRLVYYCISRNIKYWRDLKCRVLL